MTITMTMTLQFIATVFGILLVPVNHAKFCITNVEIKELHSTLNDLIFVPSETDLAAAERLANVSIEDFLPALSLVMLAVFFVAIFCRSKFSLVVSSSLKPSTVDNGLRIMVPPHMSVGQKIVVNTETLEYVKRAE